MKTVIFGIFAHPDDEAFGPSGTLLRDVKAGAELHLVTLTAGEAGENPDNHADLGQQRLVEWQSASELLGATATHYLGYRDGTLSNHTMLAAAETIEQLVRTRLSVGDDITVEFMCFDTNGISGHIDHIVATRAACLVFYRLKQYDKRMSRIRLFCIPVHALSVVNTQWLYMEPGRAESEIDEIIDARDNAGAIRAIIRSHHTQRSDGEGHIERLGTDIGLNHFMIRD